MIIYQSGDLILEREEMIKPYQIFTIHKGNRKAKWKAIEHPYFDNAYALVKDYVYLFNGKDLLQWDENHIVAGAATLQALYKQAYDHT